MLVAADLDRLVVCNNNNSPDQTLVLTLDMGRKKESPSTEEGEISASASVSKEEQKIEKPRIWTMQDLYKYQVSRNYASGLYNLAWAQAVQKKPLDEVLVNVDCNKTNDTNNDDDNKNVNNKPDNKEEALDLLKGIGTENGLPKEVSKVVVIDLSDDESEREEGELEEGEIGSDCDANRMDSDEVKGSGLERRVEIIREGLESATKIDIEESYDALCARVKSLLVSLWEEVLEDTGSTMGGLVQLAFAAVQRSNSVFCSMNQDQKEQNKYTLSRLLHHVASLKPPLFASEQTKKIEFMITSLESGASNENDSDDLKTNKGLGSVDMDFKGYNGSNTSMDTLKLETSNFRGRGLLLPLLDLHKDHDEDSLPSPTTRETPPTLPVADAMAVGSGIVKPEWPVPLAVCGAKDVTTPYYETDIFKAVSTYQQKFGHTSLHMSELPSPTPSEDGDNGNGDTNGEVSSSSVVGKSVIIENTPKVPQPVVSSSCAMDITSSSQGMANTKDIVVPIKSSAKSRDPRLRFANRNLIASNESKVGSVGETTGSKKQKPTEEPVSNGPTLKRQKNGSADFDTTPSNIKSNGYGHLSGTSTSTTISLDSLLKGIDVNPDIWMNLIKMEHQKSVDSIRTTSSLSSILETIPPVKVNLSKASAGGDQSSGILQTSQTQSTDELGKRRMKPRDPRRALHRNIVQKAASSHTNISASSISRSQEMKVGLDSQKQEDQSVRKIMTPLDITRQFTNNLKNIADIVSVSQPSVAPLVNPQVPSSQPSQVNLNSADIINVPEPSNNQNGNTSSSSEEVPVAPSRSQNAWGDVEHLFEELDDKEKAAFHKERARRIEEQKKMFAARKLCLVLDLDHTLLNSAKFAEVDRAHDEILRRKEEQDREKPHRYLFRFPHMGMWTKLRPGIWNFLEKASKLFELHLYTMGNKLYATEMAKLLDPKGTLFNGRVISRGDDGDILDGDERVPKSKDLEGVLGMESGVVIIDDSIRVWPHNKLNLIVVERYIYFPCSRRQFGLLGPSLLEIDHDERPEAGTLASSLAVIERIHQNFFAHQSLDDADVRNILASEQRKILGGCRIVFSRVIPVGEANPHLHPLWQTAEQFGAVCTNQINDQVTHVVANSLGTDKVNWALSTGRYVVHPGWVEASALLYRRANEQEFVIKS